MSAVAPAAGVERPFFFDLDAEKLFGLWHLPAGAPRAIVVMCHAFAEEKLWSHRVYVNFARDAALAACAVLRFDMRGEGDSDRDFEAADIESRVQDVVRAVEIARTEFPGVPLTLLGHRLGGSVALAAGARLADQVQRIVVWDPVQDGADYFGQLIRSNLATQMATGGKVTRSRDVLLADLRKGEQVVADGYGLSNALYEGMLTLRWAELVAAVAAPVLVLEVRKGEQTAPSDALIAAAPGRVQAGLVTEPPFWRETRTFHKRTREFTAATLKWLGVAP